MTRAAGLLFLCACWPVGAQVTASIQGIPPAERYLAYGVQVPAMVFKDFQGNVVGDQRQDRTRVAHIWKKFAHRATPTSMQDSITYGSFTLSTFWGIPSNWTGSLDTCTPGTLNPAIVEATVRQANWYRSMAGLDTVRVESDPLGPKYVQAAALVQRVAYNNGQDTSHHPLPNGCSSQDATFGSEISLLGALTGLSQRGPGFVDILVDDAGSANYFVGHRRATLHPLRSTSFYGEASAPLDPFTWYAAGALMVRPTGATLTTNVEVLWPTEGYFPYQSYPWGSKRWSMACTNCDFTGATVSVKRNGVPTPVKVEALFTAYQDQPTLVWQLTAVDYSHFFPRDTNAFTQDDVFDTTITYKDGGVAKTRTYRTTVFNPELERDDSPPYDLTDMWWNPSESGWGFDLIEGGKGDLFGTVYFYDAKGNQRWVTLQDTSWTASGQVSWTAYETRGPSYASRPFDPNKVTVARVGNATMTFSPDTSSAVFTLTVDGQTAVKQVRRFTDVPVTYGNGVNYRGMWWVPAESGWGISVAQQYQTLFSVIFTYDVDGSLLWVVMPGGTWTSEFTYEGTLYTTRQAPWDPSSFNTAAQQTTAAGTYKYTFTGPNHATLDYTIKGISDHKVIEKYAF
jgi:hypothetical protein